MVILSSDNQPPISGTARQFASGYRHTTRGSGYHITVKLKPRDLGNFRCYQAAERRQDIGVANAGTLEKLRLIHFIVEQMLVAVVLTESIVT